MIIDKIFAVISTLCYGYCFYFISATPPHPGKIAIGIGFGLCYGAAMVAWLSN